MFVDAIFSRADPHCRECGPDEEYLTSKKGANFGQIAAREAYSDSCDAVLLSECSVIGFVLMSAELVT